MIKEIPLKGITTTPDNYHCEEGSLSFAQDLISQDNSLITPPIPEQILNFPKTRKLIYIHKVPNNTNYITIDSSKKLYFSNDNGYSWKEITTLSSSLIQITSVGNCLCVLTEAGIQYILYKNDPALSNPYLTLPSEFPQIKFQCGLLGAYKSQIASQTIFVSNKISTGEYDVMVDTRSKEIDFFDNGSDFDITKNINVSSENLAPFNTSYKLTFIATKDFHTNLEMIYVLFGIKDSNGTINWIRTDRAPLLGSWKRNSWQSIYKFYDFSDNPDGINTIGITMQYRQSPSQQYTLQLQRSSKSNKSQIINDEEHPSYDVITSSVKEFIYKNSIQKHRFVYPFFVRCALKTIDNRYISLSSPMLMIPNSSSTPLMFFYSSILNQASSYDVSPILAALFCDLQFQIKNSSEISIWNDIITDLVIAVSSPIYSVDQSTDINLLKEQLYIEPYQLDESKISISAILNNDETSTQLTHGEYNEKKLFNDYFSTDDPDTHIHLPLKHNQTEELQKASNFYIIKSIPVNNLSSYSTLTKLDLTDVSLESLVNREALPDDITSLHKFMPKVCYSVNGRLHIGNYQEKIFNGYPLSTMGGTDKSKNAQNKYASIVEIAENNLSYKLKVDYDTNSDNLADIYWFYYPNINAKSATIYKSDGTCIHIPLAKHPYLNGAYWFNNYKPLATTSSGSLPSSVSDALVDKSTFVKISEPNNPLIFTNLRTYNFDSAVLAMTSAVTALSQGQAGDFDLYIFTQTTGVWSLKINSEGGYSKQIPVTRDTITNTKSLTQLDGSVIYSTSRGLMELAGSKSRCISEPLDREETISLINQDLPFIGKLLAQVQHLGLHKTDDNGADEGISPKPLDFKTYLQTAEITYDYRNQRIIIFNDSSATVSAASPAGSATGQKYPYCFSFNLRTQSWTLLTNTYCYKVNSYPDSLIVDKTNRLLNISGDTRISANPAQQQGFILTRPFSLDMPNEFKTIDQIRINGTGIFNTIYDRNNDFNHSIKADANGNNTIKEASHIQIMLYASNDLQEWDLVSTSNTGRISGKTGTPYRFFRLALASQLLPLETLDSISVSFRIKEQNDKLF